MAVVKGVLKGVWESIEGTYKRLQLILPIVKVAEVLQEIHNGTSGSHLGVNTILDEVRQRF